MLRISNPFRDLSGESGDPPGVRRLRVYIVVGWVALAAACYAGGVLMLVLGEPPPSP